MRSAVYRCLLVVCLLVVCLLVAGCIVPPFDLEGKTCTQVAPCPRDLVCVLDASGKGICRRRENVCVDAATTCERSAGVCEGKARYCGATGPEPICTATSYGADYEAVESLCDGLDNDCDGLKDGLPDAGPLRGEACLLTAGVCAGSRQACLNGNFEGTACTETSYGLDYQNLETRCDGLDNDCDGRVDYSAFVEVTAGVSHFDWVAFDQGLVAVYDAPIDDAGSHVYLSWFDNRLQRLVERLNVMGEALAFPPDYAERPRLLATDGGVYAAWLEYPALSSETNLVVGRVGAQGELLPVGRDGGTRAPVASPSGVNGTLLLTATNTHWVVGWVEPQDGGARLRAVPVSFGGEALSPVKTLVVTDHAVDSADLTWLGPSGYFAAWNGTMGLQWQRFDDQLAPKGDGGAYVLSGPVSQISTRRFSDDEPLVTVLSHEVPQPYVAVWPGLQAAPGAVGVFGNASSVQVRVTQLPNGFLVAGTSLNAAWGAVLSPGGVLSEPFTLVPDAGMPMAELAVATLGQQVAVATSFPGEKANGASTIAGELVCLPSQ